MSVVMLAVAGSLFLFAIIVSWRRKKRSSPKDDTACGDGGPSSKPPPCTPPPGQDYEVFLSFRGVDTREGFTDHLYNRLNDVGVRVFRDNEGLHVGEKIGPELIKAIRASKISILIISENYASSEWCLRELVQILECKKTGQIVLPIFYKVTPWAIRNQTGKFGEAFLLLQAKYGSKDIQEWRNTLKEVASMKGWESNKVANGHEGVLVKIVLRKVLKKLKKANLVVDDFLIGVQDHIEKIKKMVDSSASAGVGVGAILIHGMGGIGKTTLAKLIYNQFSTQYDHRSFLSNVRERSLNDRGMVELQKQLISDVLGQTSAKDITGIDSGINIIEERFRNKKVLILLDDVNHTNQLDALAKESGWFEPGSLLIITSRNKDILDKWDKKLTYELRQLDSEQSFQLFCIYAFRREGAWRQNEREHIAREIVLTTGGLPLAIKVIGSQLCARDENVWKDTLQRLKETPVEDVMKILKISYDSLNREEKQIFLDIACFAFKIEKEHAYYMWDACRFYPHRHVQNLISFSLIEVGDCDELIMHDQLSDLGKAIVREESSNDLRKHSRLWSQQDVWEVLDEIQGPKEVEALHLMPHEEFENDCLTSEHLKDLTQLRLLFLDYVNLDGDFDNQLANLKWLQWNGSYSKTMETMPINFHPKKLVVLDLWRIPVTEHWSGWSQPEVVKKLKMVRLVECHKLRTTPDFSAFKELEILILRSCSNLEKIHLSNGGVQKTVKTLSISSCDQLEELPKQHELTKLPDSVGKLGALSKLNLSTEVPESFGDLHNFEKLDILYCNDVKKLRELQLGFCDKLSVVEGIGQLMSLEKLCIDSCPLEKIDDLSQLKKMESLELHGNEMLSGVEGIGQLTSLKRLVIFRCPSIERIGDLSQLKKLVLLELHDCEMLSGVEGICQLTSLEELELNRLPCIKTIGDLSHLKKLRKLGLFNCKMLSGVDGIGQLTSLEELKLIELSCIKTIGDLHHLEKLRTLDFSRCGMLSGVEGIGQLTSLEELRLTELSCIKTIGDLHHLEKLQTLDFSRCGMLSGVEGIGQLTSLEELELCYLPCMKTIGDLSHLKKLRNLYFFDCEMLSGVDGIGQLTSLEELELHSLRCIKTIGDLSHLKKLRKLELSNCKMLSDVDGIGQLTSLEELELRRLPCIKTIGDLSHLKKLRKLDLFNCKMLSGVDGIGQLTSLEELRLVFLPCIKTIGDLSHLKKLKKLDFSYCKMLSGVEGIGQLTSLEELRLTELSCIKTIGDLPHLEKLRTLDFSSCEMLSGVEGIGQLTSLEELKLCSLPCVKTVGDLSHLKKLRVLQLQNLDELRVEGIGGLTSLEKLDIRRCPLERIGDLSQLKKVELLKLHGCEMLSGVEGIGQLTSLKTLCLEKLPCIKAIGDLSQLKNLRELHLSDCEILSKLMCSTI